MSGAELHAFALAERLAQAILDSPGVALAIFGAVLLPVILVNWMGR